MGTMGPQRELKISRQMLRNFLIDESESVGQGLILLSTGAFHLTIRTHTGGRKTRSPAFMV